MSDHPDSQLTLRQAFEVHYDKSELRRTSIEQMRLSLKCWELATGNLPIGECTNETAAKFRAWCLDVRRIGPVTINHYWASCRAIFRRVGPQQFRCPQGLGLIDHVPYMKAVKVIRKLPRRVSLEDLSKFYIACSVAKYPARAAMPASEYWRCLIVVGYFTALRKGDLFRLKFEDFDLDRGELQFSAGKTEKAGMMPLHPLVVDHIRRLCGIRGSVSPFTNARGGAFTLRWREICKKAGVPHFTLHDIRRTAASEAERARRGMAEVLLQHRPVGLTSLSYLNQTEELRETIGAMRVPVAFGHGLKMADRQEDRSRNERLMREADFRIPRKPTPHDFAFAEIEGNSTMALWWYDGYWHAIGKTQWRILKLLAQSRTTVLLRTIFSTIANQAPNKRRLTDLEWARANAAVSLLRLHLQQQLLMPQTFNPIPCLRRKGAGAALYSLVFPNRVENDGRRTTPFRAMKPTGLRRKRKAGAACPLDETAVQP